MNRDRIRMLLVEDSASDAQLLCESLQDYPHQAFEIERAERLDEAIALLTQKSFDVILSDLGLPDSTGMETCKRISPAAGQVPIIILTGANDEAIATEAMQLGVQDYLVKGQMPAAVIGRAIRYAIERGQIREALREARDRLEARVQERTAELAKHREHLEELVQERTSQLETANAQLLESEQRVRRKLESVLSPEGDLRVLDLADLIDAGALQKLMDDFYVVARVPMAIIDIKGRVLVGVGSQEVCTRFHHAHAQTCRYCIRSDTQLTGDLAQGESRLYKCKNNLWDMATPIFVAGQRVGNVFTGQFSFEDETVDREFFRAQAQKYGFDETEYLAALDRVPRLSRDKVDRGIAFLRGLADMLSQLGHSNVKLARLLAERDRLTGSLRQANEQLREQAEELQAQTEELLSTNEQLRESQDALRDLNTTLESKVAERTAELEQRASQLQEAWAKVRSESEARIAALEQLRHDDRLKTVGRLASGIAHELGTPLNVISGYAGMIAGGTLSLHDTAESARTIKAQSERIANIVRQILNFARRRPGQRMTVDLQHLARQTLDLVMPLAQKQNVRLTLTDGNGAADVKADIEQLRQVLLNLITNAVQAMNRSGTVEVAIGPASGPLPAGRADPEKYVCISVLDEGEGIPEENLSRIFDPFFTTKGPGKGTGLGLAIAEGIVREHGGWITVDSTMGKGSRFCVYLPKEGETCQNES